MKFGPVQGEKSVFSVYFYHFSLYLHWFWCEWGEGWGAGAVFWGICNHGQNHWLQLERIHYIWVVYRAFTGRTDSSWPRPEPALSARRTNRSKSTSSFRCSIIVIESILELRTTVLNPNERKNAHRMHTHSRSWLFFGIKFWRRCGPSGKINSSVVSKCSKADTYSFA